MGCCCSKEKQEKRDRGRGMKSKRALPESTGSEMEREEDDGGFESTRPASPSARLRPNSPKAVVSIKRPDRIYYIALWNYAGRSKSELSLLKGDKVMAVDTEDDAGPEWIFVTRAGGNNVGTGYVQRNYLAEAGSLDSESWYFGRISCAEAEQALYGTPDGTFLIRHHVRGESQSRYVLGVQHQHSPKHYVIKESTVDAQGQKYTNYFISYPRFKSLSELVTFYKSTDGRQVCRKLMKPAPKPAPKRSELAVEVQRHWQEIPREQLKKEEELRKTPFGSIYRALWTPSMGFPLMVSLKEVKPEITASSKHFLAEAIAMKHLFHPRLVTLYGVVSATEPFWIITETVRDGSLRTYLRNRKTTSKWFSTKAFVSIIAQIADGMEYMERKHYIHGNLACDNILVDATREDYLSVKISEFGFARNAAAGAASKPDTRQLNFGIKWMAPEIVTRGSYSTVSDVWAFAIVAYEIFTYGSEPYPGFTVDRIRQYVVDERKYPERMEVIPELAYRFMEQCWCYNANSRPSFIQCFSFFDNYFAEDHGYARIRAQS